MALFTSPREKLLWICTALVMTVIFATLFVANPLVDFFKNQNTQAVMFLCGMFLTGLAILINAIKLRPGRAELSVWIGIAAVNLMLLLRLGIPERSHLIEYSILAIFMYEALRERKRNGTNIRIPALLALLISFSVGLLDEALQYVLPNRVFDPIDILFNGMVIAMAIGFTLCISWFRKRSAK
ncbi:MAG: VanZ family protein [Flavobacterium sp.]|nr:MAG: VanZ family protein [Flavobacterium sp.]